MGEIVAAAVVSHVPSIMAPEQARIRMGGGRDTTMASSMPDIRAALDSARPDTLLIFDTHWFTTLSHIVAGAAHFKGEYTSEELPDLICDHSYDYPGAPELAEAIVKAAKEHGESALSATSPNLPLHYPTINLVHYLHRGERVLSVGVCQTAERHNFLNLGAAIADAIAECDAHVALLAAGGLSHGFWPVDQLPEHPGWDPAHIRSPEARAIDEEILRLWRAGEHSAVIDLYPKYQAFQPEGFFGHYLMMVGALGGRMCRAPGQQMSDYENAAGTGQVHVWFDLGPPDAA